MRSCACASCARLCQAALVLQGLAAYRWRCEGFETLERIDLEILIALNTSRTPVIKLFSDALWHCALRLLRAITVLGICLDHAGSGLDGVLTGTVQGKPGGQAADEFNAFFYTLVSKDTQVLFEAQGAGITCGIGS